MLENIGESIKKYWPWALGIVGIGYLLLRDTGGGDGYAASGAPGYDPALAQQANQISGEITQAQIRAESDYNLGALAATRDFNVGLVSMSSDFYATEVAAYMADKDVAIGVANSASQYAVANAQALGAAQASYNAAIGQLGVATGEVARGAGSIVSAVSQANAASSAAFARLASGALF